MNASDTDENEFSTVCAKVIIFQKNAAITNNIIENKCKQSTAHKQEGEKYPCLMKTGYYISHKQIFQVSHLSQTHTALLSDQLPHFMLTCTYLVLRVFYCLLPQSHPMAANVVSSARQWGWARPWALTCALRGAPTLQAIWGDAPSTSARARTDSSRRQPCTTHQYFLALGSDLGLSQNTGSSTLPTWVFKLWLMSQAS